MDGSGFHSSVCVSTLSPHVSYGLQLDYYQRATLTSVQSAPFATDASHSGPLPQGACGFSSAADTNRIRDDILPG